MIDKRKPVLVTGANGYVASWIVKKLLECDIPVHAAVRDVSNENKINHLKKLAAELNGSIRFFEADLLQADSYRLAMEGCELVFHTASPFMTESKDPQKDLIEPAVSGTKNVLTTVNEIATVKRVILTSSCAAIYSDAIDTVNAPKGAITEELWNTSASINYQPYSYSKTLAERCAWQIVEQQNRWDLVSINPALVLGPPLNPYSMTSESINLLKMIGGGLMRWGIPKMGVGLVDVRDVAEAHFRAAFTPEAKGRYITSAHNTDLLEMSSMLLEKYGSQFPLPRRALPKWLLMLLGASVNKLFTKSFVQKNVNIAWRADNSKIRYELQLSFRPMKETMEDAFQVLIEKGILKSKSS